MLRDGKGVVGSLGMKNQVSWLGLWRQGCVVLEVYKLNNMHE